MQYEIKPRFDASLLKTSLEARSKYFSLKLLNHTHLDNSYQMAMENIKHAHGQELVSIVGPSGVGTSVLGKKIWKHFQGWTGTDSRVNANAIWVDAPGNAGRVNEKYWIDLLKNASLRGGQAAIDKTIMTPQTDWYFLTPYPSSIDKAGSMDTRIDALATLAHERGTRVIIINQAERLFPRGNKTGCILSEQTLEDMARRTTARIVLIANYKLMLSDTNSDEWVRRQNIVHLRRYDAKAPGEMDLFTTAVLELFGHMPTDKIPKHLSHQFIEDLYRKTIGCVGFVKKALVATLRHSMESDQEITERAVLERCHPNSLMVEYAKEVNRGEGLLLDVSTDEIVRILERGCFPASPNSNAKGTNSGQTKKPKPTFGGLRIGERRPTRDQTGRPHAN